MERETPEQATVDRIVRAGFDIAVTIDSDDEIEEVTVVPDFPHRVPASWNRGSFYDLLTPETRGKARELVARARQEGGSPARHLNLSFPGNVELPVDVAAVQLAETERVLVLGTSLEHMAEMQQRLVRAQQDMEREYWQYRHAETRYQALFALSGEPVFLVEWRSLEVMEANEAAAAWAGARTAAEMEGEDAPTVMAPERAEAVRALFEMYRRGETGGRFQFKGRDGRHEAYVKSVESGSRRAILVRLVDVDGDSGSRAAPDPRSAPDMARIARSLPDGVVVLDDGGVVRWANNAFLDLVQLEPADITDGPPLTRWLQGPGSGAAVLLSTLTDRNAVRLYRSTLTGVLGLETEVEISGGRLEEGGWVLTVRPVRPRLERTVADATSLGTRVSELSGLVGTVGLKELVGSVSELVERHLISTALEATGGNRTAAAELLKLSRQTLYTKLRDLELESDGNDNGES